MTVTHCLREFLSSFSPIIAALLSKTNIAAQLSGLPSALNYLKAMGM
jgi:hypothetical protein